MKISIGSSPIRLVVGAALVFAGCSSSGGESPDGDGGNGLAGSGGTVSASGGAATGGKSGGSGGAPETGGTGGSGGGSAATGGRAESGGGGSSGGSGGESSCEEGVPCDADDPCAVGVTVCFGGEAECVAASTLPNGHGCGVDRVCLDGACESCIAGEACDMGEASCAVGVTTCSNGYQECVESGGAPDGTSCGVNSVCQGGSCEYCMDGQECSLGDECRAGALDCVQGECVDVGPAVDGTRCGSNGRCLDGACETCGSDCALANPCKQATWSCTSGTPVCTATGADLPNGTTCGADRVCASGVCVGATWELEVVSGGAQSAVVTAQLAPVVVRLRDTGGTALANVPVTISATDGAAAPTSVTTNAQGVASVTPRLGRAPGVYTFTFSAEAASPLEVTATATAPAGGTLFTVLNVDHASGSSGVPGAGTLARVTNPRGLARASDGTLYVSVAHQVLRLSPAGRVSVVAGSTSGGFGGDLGPATNALLNHPAALALDEANERLFIADVNNEVVRMVDLSSGTISTYAGGGSAAGPGYGDGGLATDAVFLWASANETGGQALSVGPDGALYVVDDRHDRIRRIDPVTGIITAWLSRPANLTCTTTAVEFVGCWAGGIGRSCNVSWAPNGEALITGTFCGTSTGGVNYAESVVRRSPNGTLVHVAGYHTTSPGSTEENVPAIGAYLPRVGGLAVDAGGNVFLSLGDDHRIRRIEAATGLIHTIAGNGAAGAVGHYVPAADAQVNTSRSLLVLPDGGIVFADMGNHAVRRIWGQ